jgi:hypothetical protein
MGAAASSSPTSSSSSSIFHFLGTERRDSLTLIERECCEKSWQLIIKSEQPSPIPEYKSFSIWFYSLCYKSLYEIIENQRHQTQLAPLVNPKTLHTIVIFMFKLISIYLSSTSSSLSSPSSPSPSSSSPSSFSHGSSIPKQEFQKYSKALALSSCHLGIVVTDYTIFENAFLSSLLIAFDSNITKNWKKLLNEIFQIILPECVRQEALLVTKRPLRLSGNSRIVRDSTVSEDVLMNYYAEYTLKLLVSENMEDNEEDEEEQQYQQHQCRLYTSLHNTVEYDMAAEIGLKGNGGNEMKRPEYSTQKSGATTVGYRSQASGSIAETYAPP